MRIIQSRGRTNLTLLEQVAVVATVARREPSLAAASARLDRDVGWISKHVSLQRCTPAHCPHTYEVLRDDLCRDIELVCAMRQIELRAPVQAAHLHERLAREKLARQTGQPPEDEVLSRDEIRALARAIKRGGGTRHRPQHHPTASAAAAPSIRTGPALQRARKALAPAPEAPAACVQITLF